MKIYFSDLHIGDGKLKDDFYYDKMFVDLLNKYKAEEPEIILIGDILELIDTYEDQQIFSNIQYTLDNFNLDYIDLIYKNHSSVFQILNEFSLIKPIKYIIGNHDYHFYYEQKFRDKLKQYIKNIEFLPYYYDEDWEIFCIHGNQFDIGNRFYYNDKNELMPSMGEMLQKYMGQYFDEEITELLPEFLVSDYDNISPQLDVFDWLNYINKRYSLSYELKSRWIDTSVNFIRTDEIKKWIKYTFPKQYFMQHLFVNKIGGMKVGEILFRIALFFINLKKSNLYLKKSQKLLTEEFLITSKELTGIQDEDLFLQKDRIKGIIMGHNHKPSFNVITKERKKKFYANTGTWKHVVTRNWGIDKHEFVRKNVVSYIIIKEKQKSLDIKLHVEENY